MAESCGEEEAEAIGGTPGAAMEVEEETGAVDTMEVDTEGDEAALTNGGRRASVCPHLWKVLLWGLDVDACSAGRPCHLCASA